MRSIQRARARTRIVSAVAACALALPILCLGAGAASATGNFPGNQTASPPPALDTSTACPSTQVTNPGFTDIEGDFFKLQIECIADYEITKGTTSSTYSPTHTVSRGQMAEFFFRLGQAGQFPWDTSTPNPNYADAGDIPAEFVPAVNALTNAKIVSGFPDNTYRASTPVSRGEMSKFIFDTLTFVGAPIGNPSGDDYFYDDDGSNFENDLNVDAAMGFYVGSPGSNGGQLSKLDQPTQRDQMAGFLARILQFAVAAGAIPGKFVPTSASLSPSSTPVGTSALATVSGANISNIAISGPCTPGVTQSNTPAPNSGGQTINLTVPISASASQGDCGLSALITYSDNSTQTFPMMLLVTAPEAAPGTYSGFTVVSVDVLDATFQATNGTTTNSFTYGQPGTAYNYSETPGTNGSTTARAISESQFALYLSGAAAPVVGDSITITYAGAGAANTFSITSDVPAAPTNVTATFTGAPATVTVTWNASTSPDVAAYQVQADATGSGTFTNVGSPVTGTQTNQVVTASPATTLTDSSQTAGGTVVYRVVAMADAHDGAASSAPSDPSAPLTLSGAPATALPGSGPTNPAITSITRPAAGSGGTTFNVSTTGSDSNTCGPTATPCKTISQAVTNAAAGDTVSVGPGTYHELVVVPKQLTLLGFGATVNASGLSQGSGDTMDASAILVTAAGSRVEGFTVHGAFGEGILVLNTSGVVLAGNTVSGNDVGKPGTTSYGECQVNGEIPGDCGEGIHLMSATTSNVVDNVSDTNSGGMLVTDELGPNTGNTLNGNLVQNNADDCGITLPSHNPNALDANGVPQPTQGGVFGNTVSNNMSLNNGLRGFGAGILFAAAGPGMASYNNTVTGNILNGNGLPGVAIHSHTPNQNVSGDIIQNNIIGQNNLLGDGEFNNLTTTGIGVQSATVPQSETINGNTIYNDVTPIFKTDNVTIA